MWSAAVVVAVAALLAPAQAGEGEGEGQGEGEGEGEGEGQGEGEDDCAVVCVDAATLSFCDAGEVVTLDCADVDVAATCALHSAAWGFDCVLPAGSACDPAYAFGRSRCAGGLACTDGVCAPGSPATPAPLEPTAGTSNSTTTSASTNVLNCQSCGTTSALWLAPVWLLRRRRR
jgi:hypothetical protein